MRRFLVVSTSQNVDPLKDSQLPQRYDPYPFNPALLALDHRVESRFTNTTCIVEVIYGDPQIVPPITSGPWSVSVNTALSSETLIVTPLLKTDTSQVPEVIGPHSYYELPANTSPGTNLITATSTKSAEDGTVSPVTLVRQVPGRKKQSTERRVPVGALVARARFFSVSMQSLATAQNYVTFINRLDWYGYSPRTLMFSGLTIDYIPDPSGIQPRGYATDVTLIFECNRNGWDHVIVDTHQSANNYEDTVRDANGKAITSTFKIYEEINFDALTALIG